MHRVLPQSTVGSQAAIARVKRIAWNTVDRWLEKAGGCYRRFNDQKISGLTVTELQADEIRTIVRGKQQPIWVFAAIEVWSRLWSSTVVGRRSYHNTLALFRDVSNRMNLEDTPLITTDGFKFYEKVIGQVFGSACVYGQVIKTRRNDRLELLRCHYNFVRPHRALKFGREVRTPAVQAGLTKRRLTLRESFSSRMVVFGVRQGRVRVRLLHYLGHRR